MNKQEIKKNPASTRPESIEKINKLLDELSDTDKITKSVDSKPQTVDEVANKWEINKKIMELFEDRMKNDSELKKGYAKILIGILIVQLLALNTWFGLKGFKIIDFADSTFDIFITGGIAEVFALVGIIVRYLFNDNLSDLLKLVIRVTNINSNVKNKSDKHKEKN